MQLDQHELFKAKLHLFLSNYDADDDMAVLHFVEARTHNVVLKIVNI